MRSIEHDTLGEMGLRWLAARCGSFRGAPEVQVAQRFVADGACLAVMYHLEFMRRCHAWGRVPKSIRYDLGELGTGVIEEADILDYFACVFEAKATRADFLGTFGGRSNKHANRATPVANLHWIVTEPGVCEAGEVPGHWGLLVRRGRGLSEKKPPAYTPRAEIDVLRFADRLLWKPQNYRSLIVPLCPNCNGDVEDRRQVGFSRKLPRHLMDADPGGKSVKA